MMPPPPPPPPPGPQDQVTVENGPYNPEKDEPLPFFVVVMTVVNTITNLCLGAVALMAFMYANTITTTWNQTSTLKQHIFLCVTGYIILMSQAVLTLSPYNGWSRFLKFKHKRNIHWIMQIIGSTLAIVGSSIRINDMRNSFETTHGLLGLLAMCFAILSLIGAIVNLILSKCEMKFVIFKLFHMTMGALTIILAFLTLIYGFTDTGFADDFGDENVEMAVAMTVIALVGTVSSAFMNMFKKMFCCS